MLLKLFTIVTLAFVTMSSSLTVYPVKKRPTLLVEEAQLKHPNPPNLRHPNPPNLKHPNLPNLKHPNLLNLNHPNPLNLKHLNPNLRGPAPQNLKHQRGLNLQMYKIRMRQELQDSLVDGAYSKLKDYEDVHLI